MCICIHVNVNIFIKIHHRFVILVQLDYLMMSHASVVEDSCVHATSITVVQNDWPILICHVSKC